MPKRILSVHLLEAIFLPIANHLPRFHFFDHFRYVFLKLAGMKIRGPCKIWNPIIVRPIGGCKNIYIGVGSSLNSGTRFGCPDASVKIGSRVQIGPYVCFETVKHGLQFIEGIGRGTKSLPITIEDEVWIGAGAIILAGVKVGKGSVIMAGAVVNRDIPPNSLAGGIPASVIKSLGAADS